VNHRILLSRAAIVLAAAAAAMPAHAADTARPAAPAAGGLDEVVVTARKREETLQEVPIAVSALGAEALERLQVANLRDISSRVPNLGVTANQTTPSSAQVYLRGIGQDDSTPTFEPGVGIYVDGVYLARLQGSLLDLGEFERIEVLRGPQGTLYGRNSSGGAISFVSKKPSLTEATYAADLTIGKFNRRDLKGSVGVPVVEGVLGARLEFLSRDMDGYVTRRSDGAELNRIDRQGARLVARWALSDAATLDFQGDVTRDRSGIQVPVPLAAGCCLAGARAPQFGYYTSDSDVPDVNRFDGGGASATLTWDLGAVELKSISAWRRLGNAFWGDLRGRSAALGGRVALFRDLNQHQWSQEIQLTSLGKSRVQWVAGLFYLDESIRNRDTLSRFHAYQQDATSAAVFGELTFDVTDALSVTAGGRYSRDEKKYSVQAISAGGTPFSGATNPDFTEFTPKLGVAYKFRDGPLVYASWQQGFKAGAIPGFPQNPRDVTDAFLPPEKVETFEVGLKADWFDGRLRTNLAYFDSKYTDLQLTLRNPTTNILEARSADADISGFELELQARPFDALTFYGTVGTTDGEYTRSTAAPGALRVGAGHVKFAPELQWTVGADWRMAVSGGALRLAANYVWTDQVYFSAAITEIASQKSVGLIDASLRFESDRNWYVGVGVQNAGNEQWASTGTDGGGGSIFVQMPKTWSLSFGFRR
jgi:iron complex outermembrane receptor protein